jgi:protoheme IX farnesyltransferase
LSKAQLSNLVVSIAAFGFLAAGPGALTAASFPVFVAASIGEALCVGLTATFNQVFEGMKQTGGRPLVTGVIGQGTTVGLGGVLELSGGLLLWLGTDPVTTMLDVGNIGMYAGVYTYLKPRSEITT